MGYTSKLYSLDEETEAESYMNAVEIKNLNSIIKAPSMMPGIQKTLNKCNQLVDFTFFVSFDSPYHHSDVNKIKSTVLGTEYLCCHKIHTLKPHPQYNWRWLGHESEVLMNEISDLIEETSEITLVTPTMWGHSKKTVFLN